MLQPAERERFCDLLVEKSAGMMLYLRLVSQGLREETLQPSGLETLESGLPGLHSRYHATFEARFREDFRETVQPLLRLIMAAPGPIPLDLAHEVLGWDPESAVRASTLVGCYLVEDVGGVSLFHETLGEWLASKNAGIYFTDAGPAAKGLGEYLWECFDELWGYPKDLIRRHRWEDFVIDWLLPLSDQTKRKDDWDSLAKLGEWFHKKSLVGRADRVYRHVLDGRILVFGMDHPDTVSSMMKMTDLRLDTLTDRERSVLEKRFGLRDGCSLTAEEVGRQLQLSAERIRQIEAKALRKMRHPTRLQKLEGFINVPNAGPRGERSVRPKAEVSADDPDDVPMGLAELIARNLDNED
jgi:hypothetical protein